MIAAQLELKSPSIPLFSKGDNPKKRVQFRSVSTSENLAFNRQSPSLEKRGQGRFWAEWRRELFDELWLQDTGHFICK